MTTANYCIYIIQNKINNKIWIGQTKNYKKRWSAHKKEAENKRQIGHPLYNSIRKYGIENFTFFIIEENLNINDANYWEEFYIQFFQTNNRNFGYNLHTGGNNHITSELTRIKIAKSKIGSKASEETKRKMSESRSGEKNCNYGKAMSDKTKLKLSIANKGKKITKEQRLKLSISHSGEKSSSAKLTWDSVNKIRNEYGVGISYNILGKKYGVDRTTIYNIINLKTWKIR